MKIQQWTSAMEKQVGARVNIVMSDPQLLSIYQKFGGHTFRRSSVFHGLGQFLAENKVRGGTCFEIGTWNGLTAVVLSKFFDRVVSVDIVHNPMKLEVLKHLGITSVECIDIGGNADKPQVLKGLDFDCAYLDGNHADDTETDFELTKKCGRVIFHECWPFQSPVWELVHSLPKNEVEFGGFGLALWQKTRPKH